MSLDTRGIDPRRPDGQRLLPQSLEDRLLAAFGRAGGGAMFLVIIALWLSLASWAVKDPSLTHTTMTSPRNWLGYPGAVISDLMLQTLGLAAILALIAPFCWSVDLAARSRVHDGRLKVGFYPLSVLAIAGALSALPAPGAWPLHHDLGGALGDGVFRAFAAAFGLLNADRAGLAASVVLFAAAASMSAKSAGVEFDDVAKRLAAALRRRQQDRIARPARRRGRSAAIAAAPGAIAPAPAVSTAAPALADHRIEPQLRAPTLPPINWRSEEPAPEFAAFLNAKARASAPPPLLPEPSLAPLKTAAPAADFTPALDLADAAPPEFVEDAAFDVFTDIQSRAIAARFAPASMKAAADIKPVYDAPPAVASMPMGRAAGLSQPRRLARAVTRSIEASAGWSWRFAALA